MEEPQKDKKETRKNSSLTTSFSGVPHSSGGPVLRSLNFPMDDSDASEAEQVKEADALDDEETTSFLQEEKELGKFRRRRAMRDRMGGSSRGNKEETGKSPENFNETGHTRDETDQLIGGERGFSINWEEPLPAEQLFNHHEEDELNGNNFTRSQRDPSILMSYTFFNNGDMTIEQSLQRERLQAANQIQFTCNTLQKAILCVFLGLSLIKILFSAKVVFFRTESFFCNQSAFIWLLVSFIIDIFSLMLNGYHLWQLNKPTHASPNKVLIYKTIIQL